jgi:hypothetical protein
MVVVLLLLVVVLAVLALRRALVAPLPLMPVPLALHLALAAALLGRLQRLGSRHGAPVLPLDVELGHGGVHILAKHLVDGHLALLAGDDLQQAARCGQVLQVGRL